MLKQLCFGGMLQVAGGIVTASGTDPPAPEYLEAIDVMLEVTGGDVLACSAGRSPVLLRFVSGGEKPRGFSVLRAHAGAFFLPLDTLPGQRVIVMMAENDQELRAALPASHFIAVPGAGGLHRFYRCGSK